MKDQDWDLIYEVHVKGSYKVIVLHSVRANDRLPKHAGQSSENRITDESSTLLQQQVSTAHSDRQTTLQPNSA